MWRCKGNGQRHTKRIGQESQSTDTKQKKKLYDNDLQTNDTQTHTHTRQVAPEWYLHTDMEICTRKQAKAVVSTQSVY